MKIKELFNTGKTIFSFEFFPPKTEKGEENLFKAIEDLKKLSPHFVSVTYGALGTTQDKSLKIINRIQTEIGLEVMAHYTCIGATEDKIDSFLQSLEAIGVENILALRGDSPQGITSDDAFKNTSFRYAIDLVRYIKGKTSHFCLGVAGYPEGHLECINPSKDLQFLKEKVDNGADFVVTQLFFDNQDFFKFRDRAQKSGLTVPLIPGIMPLENFNQIMKITSMCGSKIPHSIKEYFSRTDIPDKDKIAYGIDYTIKQCKELLAHDVSGLHFYTLNKSTATREIFKRLHPT